MTFRVLPLLMIGASCVLLALPAGASASQLSLSISPGGELALQDIDDGEHHVTVVRTAAAEWEITDYAPSATIAISEENFLQCTAPTTAPAQTSCMAMAITSLRYTGGDAADTVDLHASDLPSTVFGEGGADDLTGSDVDAGAGYDDMLEGGDGNDVIDARLGRDHLSGGAGADYLLGGGGNDDLNAVNADKDTANQCDASRDPSGYGVAGTADRIYRDPTDTHDGSCELDEVIGGDTGGHVGTPTAPHNTAAPGVPSGKAALGEVLSSSHGAWTGTEPMTFVVQWERCQNYTCSPITGATNLTYTVTSADFGHTLRTSVQAINSAGTSPVVLSPETAEVPEVVLFRGYAASGPKDPPAATGASCAGEEKATKIGAIFVCYEKSSKLSEGRWELTGKTTLNRVIYVSGAPLVIDTKRKTIEASGNLSLGVQLQSSRTRFFTASRIEITDTDSTIYPIRMTKAVWTSKRTVAGMPLQAMNIGGGLSGSGSSVFEVFGYQNTRRMRVSVGGRLLNDALSVAGTMSYYTTGKSGYTIKGCVGSGQALPLASDRIAQLRNACLTYQPALRTWQMTADASVFGTVNAKGQATLVDGALDNFDVSASGGGQLPLPFGAYLDGGGLRMSGLRSNNLTVGGSVHGGWPYGTATFGATLVITGDIEYKSAARTLWIRGTGELRASSFVIATGRVDLQLRFGDNAVPQAAQFSTQMNVLNGFILGDIQATIDGTGFFASSTVDVGFSEGAEVTRAVNQAISDLTGCWLIPFAGCPKVQASVRMQGVASNKGVGVHGRMGSSPFMVSGTVWWLSQNSSLNWHLGLNASKPLDMLNRARPVPQLAPISPFAGQAGRARTKASATTFTIPRGAHFAYLKLGGSATGNVVVRNAKKTIVADTAAGRYAPGVAFGRDPLGSGQAAIALPAGVMVPGQWTVTTSGSPGFASIVPVISADEVVAQVTRIEPIGAPKARNLVSGQSRLKISWAGPSGVTVALRATDGSGNVSLPIKRGLRARGSMVWKVAGTWAGPLRIEAVTERGGLPVSSDVFARAFTVKRAAVPAPGKVVLRRQGSSGRIAAGWRKAAGAASYDVQYRLPGTRKPITVIVAKTKAVLAVNDTRGVRIRVRGVSALGLPGRWSRWVTAKEVRFSPPAKRGSRGKRRS